MTKNVKTILIVCVIVIIVGGLAYYSSKSEKGENYNGNVGENTAPQLFFNSPMAQYAYLISAPTYDATTQTALTGFQVTRKTLADGSIEITLNAQNPEYKTQVYTVKTGEKLYFIEKYLGDDKNNEEKFLGDDSAILVDASGYIIK